MKKLISIVTPTFNEQENIEFVINEVKQVMMTSNYDYEHIIIDNNSTDKTKDILKKLSQDNKKLKLIFNLKNFGHIRSPYHAMLQSSGDAVILINADRQDPINLIPKLLEKWSLGDKVILFKKKSSNENYFLHLIKKIYYKFLNKISNINLIENSTGSGLYDKSILDQLKKINDPNPFLRGIFLEFIENGSHVEFDQNKRLFGKSKNNFFTLYDFALLGIIKHSKILIRFMSISGLLIFFLTNISLFLFLIMQIYYKILFLPFSLLVTIYFLFSFLSIIFFFMGILGEYLLHIFTHVRNLPLVVEDKRINFEDK